MWLSHVWRGRPEGLVQVVDGFLPSWLFTISWRAAFAGTLGSRRAMWPNRDRRRWSRMSLMSGRPDLWSTCALSPIHTTRSNGPSERAVRTARSNGCFFSPFGKKHCLQCFFVERAVKPDTHGPFERVLFSTRSNGPSERPVQTGSVYRALEICCHHWMSSICRWHFLWNASSVFTSADNYW